MKYCKDRIALLNGYVDETLNLAEAQRLRDHLMNCPGCKAYLKDLLAIHNNFPALDEVELPEGFTSSVMNAVRADIIRRSEGEEPEPIAPVQMPLPPKKRRLKRWKVLAPVAACLVVVVALGSQGLLTGRDTASAPVPRAASAAGGESINDAAVESQYAPEEMLGSSAATDDEGGVAGRSADVGKSTENGDDTSTTAGQTPAVVMEDLPPSQKDMASPGVYAMNTGNYFSELTLTEAEAGELLDLFTPVSEAGGVRTYELDRESYEQLLIELASQGISPVQTAMYKGAEDGSVESDVACVIVTPEQ